MVNKQGFTGLSDIAKALKCQMLCKLQDSWKPAFFRDQ